MSAAVGGAESEPAVSSASWRRWGGMYGCMLWGSENRAEGVGRRGSAVSVPSAGRTGSTRAGSVQMRCSSPKSFAFFQVQPAFRREEEKIPEFAQKDTANRHYVAVKDVLVVSRCSKPLVCSRQSRSPPILTPHESCSKRSKCHSCNHMYIIFTGKVTFGTCIRVPQVLSCAMFEDTCLWSCLNDLLLIMLGATGRPHTLKTTTSLYIRLCTQMLGARFSAISSRVDKKNHPPAKWSEIRCPIRMALPINARQRMKNNEIRKGCFNPCSDSGGFPQPTTVQSPISGSTFPFVRRNGGILGRVTNPPRHLS